MATVRDGSCQRWRLSDMAAVRDGVCQIWQLSVMAAVRDGSCQRLRLSEMADVRSAAVPSDPRLAKGTKWSMVGKNYLVVKDWPKVPNGAKLAKGT